MKERITITIDKELLNWLDDKIKAKLYSNRSHGLEILTQKKIDEETEEFLLKERITVTLDKEILDWIDKNVANRTFANRSHGFEFLIMQEILAKNEKEEHI